MKLTLGITLASLSSAVSASSAARVFIYDPELSQPAPQASSSVSPDTARLILARRLGLSRFHPITEPSKDVIHQINAFGGRQQKLFGAQDDEKSQAQLIVWLDNVQESMTLRGFESDNLVQFSVSNPPAADDDDALISHIGRHADMLPRRRDPKGNTYTTNTAIEDLLSQFGGHSMHNEYLNIWRQDASILASEPSSEDALQKLMHGNLLQSSKQALPVVVVMMPPAAVKSKHTRASWGEYSRPQIERRQNAEAILSPVAAEPSDPPKTLPSIFEDTGLVAQAEGSNTTAPLGILPSCFSSESACTKRTNGCTGHGMCKLLHKGSKGSESQRADCWACACKPEIQHSREDTGMETHTRTVYWAGPACQKKDISVPFWLFVTVGVLLAFLISTSIAMLYSMGSEELPSVIGAGVSGPIRK